MAFAPLDVWVRLLLARGSPPHPAFLPRVCANLFVSSLATIATLPERLFVAVARLGSDGERFEHAPGTVAVLGYYRSGTTHLHYLLSCDRRFVTPRWHQMLQPHGFLVTWAFLKWALFPFIPNERPQDDVAFGAEWPAEDDFAVANLELASQLIGRFVYPASRHAHFRRYQNLEELTPTELKRWRRAQTLTLWKVTRLARHKTLLLKSPCHTGRIAEFRRLLDDNVKFIHIARDPDDVVRSNVAMDGRLAGFLLERGVSPDEIRRRVIDDYERTEMKCLAEGADLPPGRLVRIRYQDLVADPVGQLRGAYGELGIEWNEEVEERITKYLRSVENYVPAAKRSKSHHSPLTPEQRQRIDRLREALDTERPAVERAVLPAGAEARHRVGRGMCVAAVSAVVCAGLWLGWAWLSGDRSDWLIWPAGVVIGLLGVRAAGAGSTLLGTACVALTLLMLAGVQMPLTFVLYDYIGIEHYVKGAVAGATATTSLLYALFGVLSAFRCATRKHIHPPGG